ncbi:cytochrome c, partial [Candidatus Sumerlaeota bacterium]|nr:cytochrome c [Candidatus Sumerlaeota bacterium]
CATCHGNEGKGDGSSREFIPMNPANLSDPAFASKKTDGEWYWKITTGRTPMNAYEDYISEEDRWNVINYIRTFSAETGRAAAPQVVAAANAGQSHPKSDSPAPVKSASIPNRAAEDEKDEPAEQEHSIHWAIVLGVAAFLAVDSIVLIIIFGRKPKAGDGSQNS